MNDADVDVGSVGENDLAFELLMLLLLLADDENVVDAKGSEDGEPAVAANSHSHNHGQASSTRCFILLIVVSLAHRQRFLPVKSVASLAGRGNRGSVV